MTRDDPRPIRYCRKCKTDVVMLPNGTCPWCVEMPGRPDPRTQVERLHRERLRRYAA